LPHPFPEEIILAAAALKRGEVVAYPTETFYGLGVNALDELALARLRQLKGPDRNDKAISVLIAGPDEDAKQAMIAALCADVPPLARALMARYWPGPLTIAMPARPDLPGALLADGCVALRESPNAVASALVATFGGPVTATSANPSGTPPATTPDAVEEAFEGRCRVLHGGTTPGGAPSTLVRVRGNRLEILRQGALLLDARDLTL
jgi:L-threonylcarbamoyladenylate synthase